jgi:hypothetical protein
MVADMKALASDYDGTLFFHDLENGFKPENTAKIKEFQDKGNLFGVCTGRPLGGVINDVKGYVDIDFYILATGAVILDKQQAPIYLKPMPRDVVREIYDSCPDDRKPAIQAGYNLYVFKCKENYRIEQTILNDFDDMPDEGLYQFSLGCGSVEEATKKCAEMNERYKGILVTYQNQDGIDVVSAGCSKGAGIKIVKEKLGIDHISGIGDSFNDISMLEAADRSFAFDYSPKEVQNKATDVVGTIADAIDMLL